METTLNRTRLLFNEHNANIIMVIGDERSEKHISFNHTDNQYRNLLKFFSSEEVLEMAKLLKKSNRQLNGMALIKRYFDLSLREAKLKIDQI